MFANAFFVAAELSLVAVRRSRVTTLAHTGNRRAMTVLQLLDNMDAVISTTQLGITLASLALGWIGEVTLSHIFEGLFAQFFPSGLPLTISAHTLAVPISFALITFFHIVLGELTPKAIALEKTESAALILARPLQLFYQTFKPFIWLLKASGTQVVRAVGLQGTPGHQSAYTEEEIRQLVSLSYQSGHLNADERELIHNIFHFTDTVVREVMTPRPTIVGVEVNAKLEAVLRAFLESGYSRLPVYEKHPDNIIGVAHSKDLLPYLHKQEAFSLKSLMRKPVFIPDTAHLAEAMRQFRAAQAQFAVVVNEHGSIEGIITMEDLLEEIVGEIHDEHDVQAEEAVYWKESDGTILLDGGISIRDANRKLELNLPESDDYSTLAGFLMTEAGKLLVPNDAVVYQGAVFTVEKVEGRRVTRVRLRPINTSTDDSLAQTGL